MTTSKPVIREALRDLKKRDGIALDLDDYPV
jgi:hypothetical protein